MNLFGTCALCFVFYVVVLGNETSVDLVQGNVKEKKVQTFEEVEKRMKDGVNSLIRRILPHLLRGASDSQISGPCSSAIMRVIGGIRQLREWAIRFVDATGKIPPGVLEGTSLSLGDFDECLDIEVGKKENPPKRPEDIIFTGQYCLLESHRPEAINKGIYEYQQGNKDTAIAKTKTFLNLFIRYKHLTNTTFKLGVCIPSKCSKEDLQSILNSESLNVVGKLEAAYCVTKERSPRTLEQNVLLGIFGFILTCILLGTSMDVFQRFRGNEKNFKSSSEKPNSLQQMTKSFSLYSNALDLVNTDIIHEPVRVLCALRTISVILTIYSHTYGHIHEMHFQKFSKAANFIRFFESFTFAGIANGSVGMDTVVFIAGITITYKRWRNLPEKGIQLNVFSLLCQRYFRMSAAQLLVIGLFLLFPLIGSGPIWNAYIEQPINNCKERWWLNILFINNFWSSIQTCMYHTWILAVIMQLTVLSVLVLWILKWFPKGGVCFMVLLILGGIIGVAVVNVIHDLPGGMAFFMLDVRTGPLTWRRVYTLAYDHMGPFCIGMLTGYFLALKKDVLRINTTVCAVLWCCAIACCSAVMFGLYDYRHGAQMGIPLAAFYAASHRNVWTLGIAWLVVACTTGHGGAITKVLKAKIFLSLDRLCYMAFLLHIPIMYYHSGTIRERWYMGHLELMFLAIAYIVVSFVVSFVMFVTIVKPFYFLEAQLSSCFGQKNKMSFRTTHKFPCTFSPSSTITTPSETDTKGCINVGYAKKLDGL